MCYLPALVVPYWEKLCPPFCCARCFEILNLVRSLSRRPAQFIPWISHRQMRYISNVGTGTEPCWCCRHNASLDKCKNAVHKAVDTSTNNEQVKISLCYISNAYTNWIRVLRVPVPRFVKRIGSKLNGLLPSFNNEKTSTFRHLAKKYSSISIIHCSLTTWH